MQFTHAYTKYILVYLAFVLASPRFEPAFDTRYSYLAAQWVGHVMVLTAAEPHVHEHSHKQMSLDHAASQQHVYVPQWRGNCLMDQICNYEC